MSLARVVAFDGVSSAHIEQVKRQIEESGPTDDIPATEIVILHDADAGTSLAIVFFENEDDYRRGDAALSAMSSDETPGRRTSVNKYAVAVRASA